MRRAALDWPPPPRVAIIRRELRRFRRPRYLEIGVHRGAVFLRVRAWRKVGVDPAPKIPRWKWLTHPNAVLRGEVEEATSNAFFAKLDAEERFDVVFIDGYHSHRQALRDIESALRHLGAEGVILVHDCNPPTAATAGPDPVEGEFLWCGEVWKAIVELRATRPDLRIATIDADFGVGVVRRGTSTPLDLDPSAIASMTYEDLDADRERLLGLTSPDDA
jgi:SAM-dependent methyltransferase